MHEAAERLTSESQSQLGMPDAPALLLLTAATPASNAHGCGWTLVNSALLLTWRFLSA